jgi:hypothetical protein
LRALDTSMGNREAELVLSAGKLREARVVGDRPECDELLARLPWPGNDLDVVLVVGEHRWKRTDIRRQVAGGVAVEDRHAWAVEAAHRHAAAEHHAGAVQRAVSDEVDNAHDPRDVADDIDGRKTDA